jgi:hypothetical protein
LAKRALSVIRQAIKIPLQDVAGAVMARVWQFGLQLGDFLEYLCGILFQLRCIDEQIGCIYFDIFVD